jgi:hypothetical protein
MGADMELSCDERVINEMVDEIKKAYSVSLLSLATGKRIINGSPLAFGEGGVGGRIKNVLNYKRPAFWVTAAAIIIAAAVGIGLLANPRQSISLTKSSAFLGDPRLDEAISVVINGPMENKAASASITEKDGNFGWGQLADFLATVKVYKKEVSLNRSEDRDKTYQIIFSKSTNSALAINFSKDFSEVWINNGVKPGYSYKVVHPSDISEYLPAFFASLDPKVLQLSAEPLAFSSDETLSIVKVDGAGKINKFEVSDNTAGAEIIDSVSADLISSHNDIEITNEWISNDFGYTVLFGSLKSDPQQGVAVLIPTGDQADISERKVLTPEKRGAIKADSIGAKASIVDVVAEDGCLWIFNIYNGFYPKE